MIKVNNKKAITNLATKSFRANKTRNIIAVIAIALTTILFTSIFTMICYIAPVNKLPLFLCYTLSSIFGKVDITDKIFVME